MKNTYLIVLFSLLFVACEKIVDIEIPSDEPTLVVEGEITDNLGPWSVRLTLSQPYLNQKQVDGITNATIFITGTDGSNVQLLHTDTGMFVSATDQQCLVGETYTLTVDYDGKTFTASEELVNGFPIDTIASYFLPDNNGFIEAGYYVFIQGKENDYKGDSYLWKFYRNDTLQDDFGPIYENDDFGDISFLNQSLDPNDPLAGLAQGIIPRPFPFTVEPGDSIRIEQYSLSKQHYKFIIDREAQLNRAGTPFDSPPANPNYNISNGGLGYFSVAHLVKESLVVKE